MQTIIKNFEWKRRDINLLYHFLTMFGMLPPMSAEAFLKLIKVQRDLNNAPVIDNISSHIGEEFKSLKGDSSIEEGDAVAVALGSRGIDRIDQVAKEVIKQIKRLGGKPFIVPAMGSHEGGTAEGQIGALAKLGITESNMGCPINGMMETAFIGRTSKGIDVCFSKAALLFAKFVVPVGRVKPHTSFTGPIESGLTKSVAVGLGKTAGAKEYHAGGYENFSFNIAQALKIIQRQVRIPFGLALVENGLSKITHAEVVQGDSINEGDERLLCMAQSLMPKLPGEKIDILIVDQIGKEISGRGMDSKVINRGYDGPLQDRPEIGKIIVRDVVGGNANGIGAADIVLQRAVKKIDQEVTLLNAYTAGTPEGARIRSVARHDLAAFDLACTQLGIPFREAKIAWIKNTKALSDIFVSESFVSQLPKDAKIVGEPVSVKFIQGMLHEGF